MNGVLIIEDDPLVASILPEMLVQEGPDLSVRLAADGREGGTLAVDKETAGDHGSYGAVG